ncbi:MAG: 2-furoyl-CoA dehydrogenase large subunit [Gaiellales bacterium]|nr:2-furoyl-CoA dehydrogenase large subunit [Gaiellales bacterium]
MSVTSARPYVGQGLPRLEDEALLRGEGRFMDDIDPVPHTRHAMIVRSPFAHARIKKMDVSAALALPGVVGVVTAEQIVAMSRPLPSGIQGGPAYYAAANGTARFMGEPVAVVVAESRYIAEDAADLIEIDYEPLDVEELEVHERHFSYGAVDAAFATADVVVESSFVFPRWSCTPVECYGVIADWRGDGLTAWANFQGPFTLHGVAAAALGIPAARLRLLTPPDSGGSFGIKAGVYVYVVLLGLVSRALGVPVRWTEDRLEHLAASAHASGRATTLEAAFASDGELLGLRWAAREDVGAYVRAPEPATLYRMHGSLSGAYRVQNIAARNVVSVTNRCPTGLNRGFGGPQLYFPLERTMDIAAARLALDPAELRRRNLVTDFPHTTPSGASYDAGDYLACLEQALAAVGYEARRAEQAAGRRIGLGIACIVEPSVSNMGYITLAQTPAERATTLPKSGNVEGCILTIGPHGGISVRISSTPQGQGHRTVTAQIVADRLGVAPADVEVIVELDTSTNAWSVSSGAYSSRFSGVAAEAVALAADRIAAKVAAIREHVGEDLSLRRVAGLCHWNPESLPEGMEPGLSTVAYYAAPGLEPPDADDRVASSASHGFVVDVAVVEIDERTGQVHVLDYATVHDAGKLLNPLIVDGQVRGGFAHGAAVALFERMLYDDQGALLTGTFVDYLCPTAPDLPDITIAHHDSPSTLSPLGAKGLGEGNTMSAPAAIGNAVADALGADEVELPLTPPRVWELLQR